MKGRPIVVNIIRPLFVCRTRPFPHRSWWVETITRSEFVHCAVEVGGVVLHPIWNRGVVFHSRDEFARAPGLAWAFDVPVERLPPLQNHRSDARKAMWQYALRYASRGLYAFPDCVSAVQAVLADAGVPTPPCLTPGDLFDHLRGKGYALCPLTQPPPPNVGSSTSPTPCSGR